MSVVSGLFMSLDGVVQADSDWQFAFFDDELFASVTAAWQRSDTAVMGRRSFEGYRALRTDHPDSPILAYLDGVQRYVVSASLEDPEWQGTTVLRDGLAGIADVSRKADGDVLVCGSPSVVRGLLARDLLDGLTITVLPIVVGSGDRLFPERGSPQLHRYPLSLRGTRALRSGAVELSYTRAA